MDILTRTPTRPRSAAERWQQKADYFYTLADSEFAAQLAEKFTIPDIQQAEAAFKETLDRISDQELRFEIDSAAGRISRAYQMLGFCAGCLSQETGAHYNY